MLVLVCLSGEAARLFFVLILHPDEPPNRIKTLLAQAANHNRVRPSAGHMHHMRRG